MVLVGVTIEEGAIIQAGSAVVNEIPKYVIRGGYPVKVFKNRDINKNLILFHVNCRIFNFSIYESFFATNTRFTYSTMVTFSCIT